MLRSVREECGLGCPPDTFTTNASESINTMLKRKVDYKRSELTVFIEKLKEMVQDQQHKLNEQMWQREVSVPKTISLPGSTRE